MFLNVSYLRRAFYYYNKLKQQSKLPTNSAPILMWITDSESMETGDSGRQSGGKSSDYLKRVENFSLCPLATL